MDSFCGMQLFPECRLRGVLRFARLHPAAAHGRQGLLDVELPLDVADLGARSPYVAWGIRP